MGTSLQKVCSSLFLLNKSLGDEGGGLGASISSSRVCMDRGVFGWVHGVGTSRGLARALLNGATWARTALVHPLQPWWCPLPSTSVVLICRISQLWPFSL